MFCEGANTFNLSRSLSDDLIVGWARWRRKATSRRAHKRGDDLSHKWMMDHGIIQ